MNKEQIEHLAREALLKCVNERPWLENYQPHIVEAISLAVAAARREALEDAAEAVTHLGDQMEARAANRFVLAEDAAAAIRALTPTTVP